MIKNNILSNQFIVEELEPIAKDPDSGKLVILRMLHVK